MTLLHDLINHDEIEEVIEQLKAEKFNINDVNQQDDDGNTPLHLACKKGLTDLAIVLMDHHASRSIRNNVGKYAIDLANRDDDKLISKFSRKGKMTSSDRYSEYSSEADDLASSSQTSRLYFACRNGQINKVKELLEHLKPDDIDRVQSNGSTALHAACYFNHCEIVEMLLKAGASRGIKNKHGCVPYEETNDKIIQALFKRIEGAGRYVADTGKIEWVVMTSYVSEGAAAKRRLLQIYGKKPLQELLENVKRYYLSTELKNTDKSEQMMYFFDQAIGKGDPEYIIRAYTAETGFYSNLNRDLAREATAGERERRIIVGIIMYNPKFDKYTYIGEAYRGMRVTDEDLNQYKVGSTIMTKSFLSTTRDKKMAESFAENTTPRTNDKGDIILKFPAFCTYIIKNKRTALAVDKVSEYQDEKEVLIMPYVLFTVKSVQQRSSQHGGSRFVDITLGECEPCDDQ